MCKLHSHNPYPGAHNMCVECGQPADKSMVCESHKALYDVPRSAKMIAAVHFVGFRGDEYWSAVRVWGKPHFIHIGNDPRMRREIAPWDTVIFANHSQARPADRNYQDTKEILP